MHEQVALKYDHVMHEQVALKRLNNLYLESIPRKQMASASFLKNQKSLK